MKFPSIFNKIKPQSIQQHPEKNQLNWMLELNKWKEERILTGEIHRPECRNEAAKRINCAFCRNRMTLIYQDLIYLPTTVAAKLHLYQS